MKDYTSLLSLLYTQFNYFQSLIERRNEFSDQAMNTKISQYWMSTEERTPLQLAYHAISPLNQLCEILHHPSELEWGEIEPDRIEVESASMEFIQLYKSVLEKAERVLKQVDLTKLSGNMASLADDPATFENRLKIFCMHVMTHYGQAIKFHGMICASLSRGTPLVSN